MMKFIIECDNSREFEQALKALRGEKTNSEYTPQVIPAEIEQKPLAEAIAYEKAWAEKEEAYKKYEENQRVEASTEATYQRAVEKNSDPMASVLAAVNDIEREGQKEADTAAETSKTVKPARRSSKAKEEAKKGQSEDTTAKEVEPRPDSAEYYQPEPTNDTPQLETVVETKPEVPKGKPITAEDLRALCFPLNKHSAEAKAAVQKAVRSTGAENFSSIPEDKYDELYERLKLLCAECGIDPTTV